MKTINYFKVLSICLLFLTTSSKETMAQNAPKDNQTITITVETKDKAGNKSIKKIIRENENLSENEIQKITDDLIKENEGKDVKIDVNVEEQKAVKSDAQGKTAKVIIKRNKKDIGDKEDVKIIVDGKELNLDKDSTNEKVIIIEDGDRSMNKLLPKDFLKNLDVNLDSILSNLDVKIENLNFMSKLPFLGVRPGNETQNGNGVLIGEVIEGSSAEKAGLKAGDVVTSIDGNMINNFDELTQEIKKHKPGEVVDIVYNRDGGQNSVKATLGEKEGNYLTFPHGNFNFDDFKWESDKKTNDNYDHQDQGFRYMNPGNFNAPKSNKAQLGVMVENNNGSGVKITDIVEGTAAYHAGLRKGDILEKIDKVSINDPDQLIETISAMKPGQEIKLSYRRDGKKKTIELVLGRKKNSPDFEFEPEMNNNRKTYIFKNGEKGLSLDSDAPQLNLQKLDIFPNPSNGKVNLNFKSDSNDEVTIKILNVDGKEIIREDLKGNQGEFEKTIDINNAKPGVYIIRIEQDGKMTTEKIILNK